MSSIIENEVPVLNLQQRADLLLWQRVNASLTAFYKLQEHYGSAQLALKGSEAQWKLLTIHSKHIKRHIEANEEEDNDFLKDIQSRIVQGEFNIIFQSQDRYPQQLLTLYYSPPLLFYRGNLQRLNQSQIAIVGSRKPTQKAQKFTFDMAQYLAQAGYIITSGLAQGVDAQAHLGALALPTEQSGRTIGVMGTGIDIYYPAPHRALFDRIINEGGCIVSELLPGTQPNKHTFPRRNRIVAGLSLGTIVTEAAVQSGSLITARLTSEQGKQVFALPSNIDNISAEGCHHLIREGATLVYHPDQIIEDIRSQVMSFNNSDEQDLSILQQQNYPEQRSENKGSLFIDQNLNNINSLTKGNLKDKFNTTQKDLKSTFKNRSLPSNASYPIVEEQKSVTIPEHLQPLWMHVEFEPQDLDALITKTKLDTACLLSQLMELELMGAVIEAGGRYRRI